MIPARVPWKGLAGALAIAVGLALAAFAFLGATDSGDDSPRVSVPDGIVARTAVAPRTVAFGARVVASVRVVLDRAAIPPESLRLRTTFSPFEVVASHVGTRDVGRATEVRYRLTLGCLSGGCLPPMPRRREFAFPPATLEYARDGVPRELRLRWPRVGVASHVSTAELNANHGVSPLLIGDLGQSGLTFSKVIGNLRAGADTPPVVTYRVAPGPLSAALFAVAGLLAVASVGVVLHRLWPGAVALAALTERRRPPVEEALGAVDLALADGRVDEQRRALELLGRALREDGDESRARHARRLAWSRPTLERDEARGLADDVRREHVVERDGDA